MALVRFAPMYLADMVQPVAIAVGFTLFGVTVAAPELHRLVTPKQEIVIRDGKRVNDEVPGGLVDGTNRVFQLANEPVPGSLALFVDRARQLVGRDYLYVGRTITFAADAVPQAGASLVAEYSR